MRNEGETTLQLTDGLWEEMITIEYEDPEHPTRTEEEEEDGGNLDEGEVHAMMETWGYM